MIKVKPTEVYADNGDLEKIIFNNLDGKFEIQAVWDENDPNDEEHRDKFRAWAYRLLKQLDYEVLSES
jgi:hypothetical protein